MIDVYHRPLSHVSGSKRYDLICVANTITNRSISILRWGKVGQNGQCQVKTHVSRSGAMLYVDRKHRDKEKRGYSKITEIEDTIETLPADGLRPRLMDILDAYPLEKMHELYLGLDSDSASKEVAKPKKQISRDSITAADVRDDRSVLDKMSSGYKHYGAWS